MIDYILVNLVFAGILAYVGGKLYLGLTHPKSKLFRDTLTAMILFSILIFLIIAIMVSVNSIFYVVEELGLTIFLSVIVGTIMYSLSVSREPTTPTFHKMGESVDEIILKYYPRREIQILEGYPIVDAPLYRLGKIFKHIFIIIGICIIVSIIIYGLLPTTWFGSLILFQIFLICFLTIDISLGKVTSQRDIGKEITRL